MMTHNLQAFLLLMVHNSKLVIFNPTQTLCVKLEEVTAAAQSKNMLIHVFVVVVLHKL